jgi:hypothetical protein
MSDVIPFPQKRSHDAYFGGCPFCGCSDGWLNVGRVHWIRCDWHHTKWSPGANLFSSWREEDQGIWQRNSYLLSTYREVEPRFCDADLNVDLPIDFGVDDDVPF